jgi:hypothetical protein
MCVESMKAIDRCLHSNGSSTTGACCSLLGVAHFSCAGYPEDFFASESGPGLPPSFYSELAAFILSGSCFGGGGGDDCDFDRVIPQVFRSVPCQVLGPLNSELCYCCDVFVLQSLRRLRDNQRELRDWGGLQCQWPDVLPS